MKNATLASSRHDEWRVEDDLRILLESDKIRADKKRMDKVRALAKQKVLDTAAIAAMTEKDAT
jgi:hypothetical protein